MVGRDRVVAVTGATGRQGGAVARHLLSVGWRVRALTRKPDGPAAGALAVLGAELDLASDVQSIAQCGQIWHDVYGRPPRRFPMPVWMFRRFAGSDLLTMWRWLQTAQVEFDPTRTRELLPTALTVRQWLVRRRTQAT